MQRRDFIRLLGGGILIVAGGSQMGCTTARSSATEAWLGPIDTQDKRLRWLSYALLAPNPHNRQPWLLDLHSDSQKVTLYVDRQRLLPATDPHSRQIVIGHGTFIEQLAIAASADGFAADVTPFPAGEFAADAVDDRPLATITFRQSNRVSLDPLFDAILRRRTNRGPFDPLRPVPQEKCAAIVAAAQRPGIEVGSTLDEAMVMKLRQRATAAWDIEQATPATVMESLRLLRVGTSEIEAHRDGLAVKGLLPELGAALGLFRRDAPPEPDSIAARRMRDSVVSLSGSAMGWVWLVTQGNSRSSQVEAGRAFVRMQLAATQAGIALHPMSQALQEFPEMREQFLGLHRDLGTSADTQTIQMLARIGYAPDSEPTPRRRLNDLMREAA